MELIDEYKDKIDDFNARIVDIHCRLSTNITDLRELSSIQKDLDRLTAEYYMFESIQIESIDDAREQMNDMEIKHMKKAPFLILWGLIPIIGLLIAIVSIINNYLFLKTVRTAKTYLNDLEKELTEKSEMIEKNLQSKYAFLDKKLSTYIGKDEEKKYSIYYANEIISNYLDGYDVCPELLDPITQELMRQMLQKDLKSDSMDLEELLYLARKKNTDEIILTRKKD